MRNPRIERADSRIVSKPEVMVRSGLLAELPHSPSTGTSGDLFRYAPHVMPQRSASHCDPRTCSFSKYRKTNILQMSEKIEFP
jgi:hypothetical protein